MRKTREKGGSLVCEAAGQRRALPGAGGWLGLLLVACSGAAWGGQSAGPGVLVWYSPVSGVLSFETADAAYWAPVGDTIRPTTADLDSDGYDDLAVGDSGWEDVGAVFSVWGGR